MILAAITTHKRMPNMVERALKSVIVQTYTDWNLVVVDDSPPDWEFRDDVRKMVEGYAEKDSRIRYVAHDRNYGAQRARNNALKIADEEGFEFIAYLDDDDEWLPEKLEKQFARLNECDENTALVYCFCYYVDDETGKISAFKYGKFLEGYIHDELMLGNFIASVFPLVRVKCLIEIGKFNEEMVSHQDYDMWIKLSEHYKFVCLPEPLAKYHIHNGEHIGSTIRGIKGRKQIISKNKAYLEAHKYAYWAQLKGLMYMYMWNGEKKKSFMTWLKMLSLQPLRVIDNTYLVIDMLISITLKAWLKRKHPGLFNKLKRLKQKLKG